MAVEMKSPEQLLESVLDLLKGVKQGRRGYTACCPSHNDGHPSLEVWTDETDGHVGLVCYAGCTREQIVQSIGLQEVDLYLNRNTKYRGKKRPVIDLLDLAVDKLITTTFLINLGCLETKRGIKIPYHDIDGKEYPRARLRTALKATDGSKWTDGDKPLIPYGLDRLEDVRQAGYLVIPEGESDCWTLWLHGYPALGIPGVSQYAKVELAHLTGIDKVYIIQEPPSEEDIAHRRDPGKQFVRNLSRHLIEIGYAGKVYVLDLHSRTGAKDPNELHKKGVKAFQVTFQACLDQAKAVDYDPEQEQDEDILPEIIVGEHQLRDRNKQALDALRKKHARNPQLFVYTSLISKVAKNEKDESVIMPVGVASLRNELSEAANFYKAKSANGETFLVDVAPPKEMAEQLLALEPSRWPFPPLKCIVEAPVLRPDGTMLDTPGYDEATRLYYVPSPEMEGCKIPANPTREDALAAKEFLRPIFADFPFEGQADHANT